MWLISGPPPPPYHTGGQGNENKKITKIRQSNAIIACQSKHYQSYYQLSGHSYEVVCETQPVRTKPRNV